MTIKETNLKFKNALSIRCSTKKIVLHHAAATTADAKTIHQWHLNNGLAGIGYHFVVHRNGTIERGRPINTIGAHCTGQNSDSVGICFEGDFEKEKMSDKQIKAGQELMSYLYKMYELNKNNVKRHKDLMSTSCPGKNFLFDEIIKGTTSISTTKKTNITSSTKITKSMKKTIPTLASANPILRKGTQVKYLQQDLNYVLKCSLVVDGDFGTNTYNQLKAFQKKYKLTVDGEYSSKSKAKMKSLLK